MSRHRNVRHLIAEEDYDYDDDYFDDDDYDDYDTYTGGSTQQQQKQSNNNRNKKPQQQPAKQPPKQQPKQQSAVASKQQQPAAKAGKGAGVVGQQPGNKTTNNNVASSQRKTPPPPPPPSFAVVDLGDAKNKQQTTKKAASAAKTTTPSSTSSSLSQQQQPQSASQTDGSKTTKKSSSNKRAIPAALLPESNPQLKKPPMTVVVLGHVDAGKSTVTGRLLYETATAASAGSGSSAKSKSSAAAAKGMNFAWLLDEDEQERAHGVTMDVATKTLVTPYRHRTVIIQDAPGHADYVPAMITGTAAAHAALLVVDVTDFQTAFTAGQLREHATLARGLGITQVIVVMNKMDLIDWNQEAFQEIVQPLRKFLQTQMGWRADRILFVPVSGQTGANITQPLHPSRDAKLLAWYNNNGSKKDNDDKPRQQAPTLWEALDLLEGPGDSDDNNDSTTATTAAMQFSYAQLLEKPLRILLTDVLSEGGGGGSASVAVRARVLQGWVQAGTSLLVLPLGDSTKLTKLVPLQSSISSGGGGGGAKTQYAASGDVVDAVLTGVDPARVTAGSLLCRHDEPRPSAATTFRARIWVLDRLQVPIVRGAQAVLHMHHLDVPCQISKLLCTLTRDGTAAAQQNPRALTKHVQATVEIQVMVAPICMEPFTDCRELGRFVLRRSGESIAVGRIEHVMAVTTTTS